MACFSYIEGWYNPVRLHSALAYRSPITYEADKEAAPTETWAASPQPSTEPGQSQAQPHICPPGHLKRSETVPGLTPMPLGPEQLRAYWLGRPWSGAGRAGAPSTTRHRNQARRRRSCLVPVIVGRTPCYEAPCALFSNSERPVTWKNRKVVLRPAKLLIWRMDLGAWQVWRGPDPCFCNRNA